MTLGDKIRNARESAGLTQEELGKKCGTTKQTIYKYEIGKITNIPIDRLERIAEIVGVSTASLLGWESESTTSEITSPFQPIPRMKRWQVIGGVACGEPIHREIEEETVLAPADIDADRVFRCVGDSMIGAHIFDGDLVFVKTGEYVEDGKIGVVRVGDEYSLKRIYRGADYLELRSENPAYSPIIIRGEQENAEIVGKAVQFLSRVI